MTDIPNVRWPEYGEYVTTALTGSQLYGTATVDSDHDWLHVRIPPIREVLLGAARDEWRIPRQDGHEARVLSLLRYVQLVARGDMQAIELLWASPPQGLPVWDRILRDRHLLVSRELTQARRYLKRCLSWARILIKDDEWRTGDERKHVAHTLRILRQTRDLLRTGRIVFPLPYASELREVISGTHPRPLNLGYELNHWEDTLAMAEGDSRLEATTDLPRWEYWVARVYLERARYPFT